MDEDLTATLQRDATNDVLLVAAPPALLTALTDLHFEASENEYVRRFPAGSVSDEIFSRFSVALGPMLRQAARLQPTPWQDALHQAALQLDAAHVDWWLTGSAALAVRGLELTPRDLDLVIAEESVPAAIEAFEGAAIEPAIPATDWFCSWWGRAWLGARVEWVGGVIDLADQPLPTDFGPIAASNLEQVEWQGLKLHVPPASLQREVSERRGLHDRVELLDHSGLLV